MRRRIPSALRITQPLLEGLDSDAVQPHASPFFVRSIRRQTFFVVPFSVAAHRLSKIGKNRTSPFVRLASRRVRALITPPNGLLREVLS
jgi:hypothetical protein